MKAVADTLAVARSNLIELVSRRAKSRRPYRKAGDNELLALIRRLVDERPTDGYRRIRRLINRQRKANGKPPVNGKRVLRIMQANKLTLERHTGRRPGRTHDGVCKGLWSAFTRICRILPFLAQPATCPVKRGAHQRHIPKAVDYSQLTPAPSRSFPPLRPREPTVESRTVLASAPYQLQVSPPQQRLPGFGQSPSRPSQQLCEAISNYEGVVWLMVCL